VPRRIALVTDSTAYLPSELVERYDIHVVPLQVVLDGRPFDEGSGISGHDVAQALRHSHHVSTSRARPAQLLDVYRDAADRGAVEIVSVHLSSELSGTHESAKLAAQDSPVLVHVVDSRSLGMGVGFAVLEAARVRDEGGDGLTAASAAQSRAAATAVFFYVQTLEYLRRGGRLTAAQALIGTALGVKPLLHILDGRIQPLENVRTASRALRRLEESAVDRAGLDRVDIAVHHLDSLERAQMLADRLKHRLPAVRDVLVSEVGPVVGAHVGAGLVAVVGAPVKA
jgi:DegV family protein with EDD domain